MKNFESFSPTLFLCVISERFFWVCACVCTRMNQQFASSNLHVFILEIYAISHCLISFSRMNTQSSLCALVVAVRARGRGVPRRRRQNDAGQSEAAAEGADRGRGESQRRPRLKNYSQMRVVFLGTCAYSVEQQCKCCFVLSKLGPVSKDDFVQSCHYSYRFMR